MARGVPSLDGGTYLGHGGTYRTGTRRNYVLYLEAFGAAVGRGLGQGMRGEPMASHLSSCVLKLSHCSGRGTVTGTGSGTNGLSSFSVYDEAFTLQWGGGGVLGQAKRGVLMAWHLSLVSCTVQYSISQCFPFLVPNSPSVSVKLILVLVASPVPV